MAARLRRPSGSISISSTRGTCLTSTAMFTASPRRHEPDALRHRRYRLIGRRAGSRRLAAALLLRHPAAEFRLRRRFAFWLARLLRSY